MSGRHLYLWAFLIAAGTISYYDLKKCKMLPWPPRLIKTGLVFGILDLVSIFNEEIAGVTAIGLVIATFVQNGWVSDCEHPQATGQPQKTKFIGNSLATPQPQSYSQFAPATGQSSNAAPATVPNQRVQI